MVFNSVIFAFFLPPLLALYWFISSERLKAQNALLLLASYFFYAWFDYRFLALLFFSTWLDYYTGLKIFEAQTQGQKRAWLWLSIAINLSFLGFFKYFNFFTSVSNDLFAIMHLGVHSRALDLILPIGISFYTFHGLSYVIDIYKLRIAPERNFITYSLFVSFFPLLVAGPIERATHLLPQVKQPRTFNAFAFVLGLRQMLWGLFKKIVIADQCAQIVNQIYENHAIQSGSNHFIAALLFAFQIYCDFSGYTDIAIGTARLFGFELLQNFSFPYFSRDMAEFWRRWHISLSSWFKDYVYIPMGGSKGKLWEQVRNTFIIFLISGFWHGANWTFIIWGALNAVLVLPSIVFKTNRQNMLIVGHDRVWPTLKEVGQMTLTFACTVLAWIFFRSNNLHEAVHFIEIMLSASILHAPTVLPKKLLIIIVAFMLIEWLGRKSTFAIETLTALPKTMRILFYYVLVFVTIYFAGAQEKFIYFQF